MGFYLEEICHKDIQQYPMKKRAANLTVSTFTGHWNLAIKRLTLLLNAVDTKCNCNDLLQNYLVTC